MAATLSPSPKQQFFDANGNPLVGGKLYSYVAGTTSPLATYVDSAGSTTNTNPIILDSRGEANVWLGANTYKLALYSAVDVLIWTVDDISAAASDTLAALAASGGSSLVGYLPAGTGAVATTVQAKLRESVSVLDFGADPTGVADTTSAINTAAALGYSLYFPAGTYKIAGQVNPASYTKWYANKDATLKWSTVNSLISLTSKISWEMEGLIIDGNYTAYAPSGTGDKPWGVKLEACTNIHIHHNTFQNIWRIGVMVGDTNTTPNVGVTIENNYFNNIGKTTDPVVGFGNAIAVGCGKNVVITKNHITNVTGATTATAAINLEPFDNTYTARDIWVTENYIDTVNNAAGIQTIMTGVLNSSFDNINIVLNRINSTGTSAGILLNGFGITTVDNNYLALTQGIKAIRHDETSLTITNNTVNSTSTGHGIEVNAVRFLTVTNNKIFSVAGDGMNIAASGAAFAGATDKLRNAIVSNNIIKTCIGNGIKIQLYNFVVDGNSIVNCGSGGSTAVYYIAGYSGTLTSKWGVIANNTMQHLAGTVLSAFINCEATLFDVVEFDQKRAQMIGGESFTLFYFNDYLVAGRCPGIITATIPSAGTWAVGDVVSRLAPTAGGTMGWVCTTAPTTFKAMANLAA